MPRRAAVAVVEPAHRRQPAPYRVTHCDQQGEPLTEAQWQRVSELVSRWYALALAAWLRAQAEQEEASIDRSER